MLPRSMRLSREGFAGYRGLLRASSPHFSISYGNTQKTGGTGIVVPKKAVKGAVIRHQLKRRLRSLLHPLSSKDRTIILTARSGAEKLSYAEIESELSPTFASIMN